MSTKYPGGLITKTPVTPAGPYETGAAPGVWTVEQALQYTKQGIWPTAGNQDPANIYIEYLFQTYLYTGNSSTQTITNGIDLSTKGGLVWQKTRDGGTTIHVLCDTARGVNDVLQSNDTSGSINNGGTDAVYAYNANGFSTGTVNGTAINLNNRTAVSWTFRKQPKFFDIVTWTGNGTSGRTISHNLGSTPGMVIVKITSGSDSWAVWHTSTSDGYLYLDSTSAKMTAGAANIFGNGSTTVSPTSTAFTVGNNNLVNVNGSTYVAYLFAHNAGGFGLTGTDNVISCGSFTLTGGTDIIDLGYEPQWLLTKRVSAASNWQLTDNMRGMTVSNSAAYLYPNLSNAETSGGFGLVPTATGISIRAGSTGSPDDVFIYIAIRRGPMKVPTDASKVYTMALTTASAPNNTNSVTSGFPVDLWITRTQPSPFADPSLWMPRLTTLSLDSSSTGAEGANPFTNLKFDGNTGIVNRTGSTGGTDLYPNWMLQRAPSFFDVVCYTGTGTAGQTYTHNLGVVPELMIVKTRSGSSNWFAYTSTTGNTQYLLPNATIGVQTATSVWNNTTPTASVFTLGSSGAVNGSGSTYVAYLFATCAGVSKVGSYTGTGATQTINCGFGAGGARWVMVKRTDTTGDWYVWDSARGMVSGTDPSLLLNSTAAEVNANSIYAISTGFQIVSTAAGINASGGSYIFLSIA